MSASRVAVLREKLDGLRRLDEDCRVFGASHHRYDELPVVDEARLSAWEVQHGVNLPDELRLFYLRVHGGGPGPGYGMIELTDDPRAAQAFPFSDADVAALLVRRCHDRGAFLPFPAAGSDDWPPGGGFVHLAHLGCGVFDVLVTTGEQRGRVFSTDVGYVPHHDGLVQRGGFFDWYERWLDTGLASLAAPAPGAWYQRILQR